MATRGEEDMRGQKESEQQVFHGNVQKALVSSLYNIPS